jgi:hypothetical protein
MAVRHAFNLSVSFVMLTAALYAQAGATSGQPPRPLPPPAPIPKLPAEQHPDISGIWNRLDTEGGGSYTGISLTFPIAQLRPEYEAKLPPQQYGGVGAAPPGFTPPAYDINGQAPTPARCAVGGGGFNAGGGGINIDSSGMSLMVGPDEVLMLRDGAQGARHIRLDGKGFPDPTRMNGLFSIGRWDGDNLVVTTRGFTSGMTAFGRGWTEPSTELTETFQLQLGAKRLVVTYTYSDPNVYVKPHTYHMEFERLPSDVNIVENWCDAKEWIDWNIRQQAGGAVRPANGPAPTAGRPAAVGN